MPGKPAPEGADDRAMLYALPEDQPDSLSEGHKSKQADLDETPAQKAGTPDPGSKGQDPVVDNGAGRDVAPAQAPAKAEPKAEKPAPKKSPSK